MTNAEAPAPPYAKLGARIRSARLRTGLSQETFAPLIGTSRRHLIRLEGGWHRPGDELLERISAETGQSRSFFDEREVPAEEAGRFRRAGEHDAGGSDGSAATRRADAEAADVAGPVIGDAA